MILKILIFENKMTIDYGTLFSNLNFTFMYNTFDVLFHLIVLYHACRVTRTMFGYLRRTEFTSGNIEVKLADVNAKLNKHKHVLSSQICELDHTMNSNLIRLGDIIKDLSTKFEVLSANMDARDVCENKDVLDDFMKVLGCVADADSESTDSELESSSDESSEDSDSDSESDSNEESTDESELPNLGDLTNVDPIINESDNLDSSSS